MIVSAVRCDRQPLLLTAMPHRREHVLDRGGSPGEGSRPDVPPVLRPKIVERQHPLPILVQASDRLRTLRPILCRERPQHSLRLPPIRHHPASGADSASRSGAVTSSSSKRHGSDSPSGSWTPREEPETPGPSDRLSRSSPDPLASPPSKCVGAPDDRSLFLAALSDRRTGSSPTRRSIAGRPGTMASGRQSTGCRPIHEDNRVVFRQPGQTGGSRHEVRCRRPSRSR